MPIFFTEKSLNSKASFFPAVIVSIIHLIFCLIETSNAQVTLPAILSDNMVLQQDTTVTLWGWAEGGEKISISADWSEVEHITYADYNGDWQLNLETPAYGGPYEIRISASNEIRLENVMIGEVWIASGQSNMDFTLGNYEGGYYSGVFNYEEEIQQADYPKIRMFRAEKQIGKEAAKVVSGEWKITTPETSCDFSAVAYFFGRKLYEETGIPVGLINASWGGTPLAAWTKKEVLQADNQYLQIVEKYQDGLDKFLEIETPPNLKNYPSVLYNGMLAPLKYLTIKGIIWYQGEKDRNRPTLYKNLFPDFVQSLRYERNNPEMPFYFVQVTPHEVLTPEIREAQLESFKKVDHTGMVVTTDIGNATDIHPRNKQEVGRRLALWALAKNYGYDQIQFSGPIYESMEIESNRIRLHFNYVGEGFLVKGDEITDFTIAGPDRNFVQAKAKIDGSAIVVWNEDVPNPQAVRFAWKNVPSHNLFNSAELPASPFRTDNWPTDLVP